MDGAASVHMPFRESSRDAGPAAGEGSERKPGHSTRKSARRRKRPRFPSPGSKVEQQTRRRRTDIAKRRLAEQITPEQIQFDFIHWGIDGQEAKRIVDEAVMEFEAERFRECVQPIWVGGSMLLVGLLLTMIGADRSSFADGQIHRYLILGVTILPAAAAYAVFGLIHLFAAQQESKRSDPKAAPVVEAGPPPELPDHSAAEEPASAGELEYQRAAA